MPRRGFLKDKFQNSSHREDGLVTPFLHKQLAKGLAQEEDGTFIFHGFSGGSSRAWGYVPKWVFPKMGGVPLVFLQTTPNKGYPQQPPH